MNEDAEAAASHGSSVSTAVTGPLEVSDRNYSSGRSAEDERSNPSAGIEGHDWEEGGNSRSNRANEEIGSCENDEDEGVKLLREIFPEMSTPELHALHKERIRTVAMQNSGGGTVDSSSNMDIRPTRCSGGQEMETLEVVLQSELAKSILQSYHKVDEESPSSGTCASANPQVPIQQVELPCDFLRVPSDVAVALRNSATGRMEWKLVKALEQNVLASLDTVGEGWSRGASFASFDPFRPEEGPTKEEFVNLTLAVRRNDNVGLGMTIHEEDGCIYVHALINEDGSRVYEDSFDEVDSTEKNMMSPAMAFPGPAQMAGVLPGDRVLGINGRGFFQGQLLPEIGAMTTISIVKLHGPEILRSAVDAIVCTADPVVLHLRRYSRHARQRRRKKYVLGKENTISLGSHVAHIPSPPTSARETQSTGQPENKTASLGFSLSTPVLERKTKRHVGTRKNEEDIIKEHMSPNDAVQWSNVLSPPLSTEKSQPKLQEDERNGDEAGDNMRPPEIHPLAKALDAKGLLRSPNEDMIVTKQLRQFTARARQWESLSSLRIDAHSGELREHVDPRDLPPSDVSSALPFEYAHARSLRPFAPSTPPVSFSRPEPPFSTAPHSLHGSETPTSRNRKPNGDNQHGWKASSQSSLLVEDDDEMELNGLLNQGGNQSRGIVSASSQHRLDINSKKKKMGKYPAAMLGKKSSKSRFNDEIFIPLTGVRKALCVRIVNTFMDGANTAYTIWVYDTESGKEWYAPVRYYRDFKDLRSSTLRLNPAISQIPFPTMGWGVWGGDAAESANAKENRCKQLEAFLRALCGVIYTGKLHSRVDEVAVHLQSFLGTEAYLGEDLDHDSNDFIQTKSSLQEVKHREYGRAMKDSDDELKRNTRLLLQRSIQRYTYRLFLLPVLEKIILHFIDEAQQRAPTVNQLVEFSRSNRAALKQKALEELEKMRDFLDQLQELIFEGCLEDFIGISSRRDFSCLDFSMKKDDSDRDKIFNEGVREQLELEIYVPLRSSISRQLVNGWRHDDLEMQFKVQALKPRPQSFFKIHDENQSPTDWSSVAAILNEGVGRSTLPCGKLRAIVAAAKEIVRLNSEEDLPKESSYSNGHTNQEDGAGGSQNASLGADDFLPIFIFCVVRAELERPCALCVLLRTLCDPLKRIGETGYYLASFEAAIEHIREIDLTENMGDKVFVG